MRDIGSFETEGDEETQRFSSMRKSELEQVAIAAILKHRYLLVADEAVYAEWTRANDDPTVSGSDC